MVETTGFTACKHDHSLLFQGPGSEGQAWTARHLPTSPEATHTCGLCSPDWKQYCSLLAHHAFTSWEPQASPVMMPRALEVLRPVLNDPWQPRVHAVAVRCFSHDRQPTMPGSLRPGQGLAEKAASTASQGCPSSQAGEEGPPSMAEPLGVNRLRLQHRKGRWARRCASCCSSSPQEAEPWPTGNWWGNLCALPEIRPRGRPRPLEKEGVTMSRQRWGLGIHSHLA